MLSVSGADVAPDKFVLMLQGFKTGGCLGSLGLTLAWLVTEEGLWVRCTPASDADGFRRSKPSRRRKGLHRHQRP